jgi:uncharacterized protein (TIGR00255 family)
MTGYAYQEARDEATSLSVEIKGYNSRFLEVFVSAPPLLSALEPEVRGIAAETIARGKIEISIRLKDEKAVSALVHTEIARSYAEAAGILAEALGLDEKPGLPLLLGLEGVIEFEKTRDDERYWRLLEPVLRAALDRFNAERIREGGRTQDAVLSYIGALEESVRRIAAYTPEVETTIRENLRARFIELLGGGYADNPALENRLLAETAVLLMKYTIAEEIVRLDSHLAEFRAETARNERPGKKLDFLCQEINREINTIGSKTGVLAVSREVVAMKDALENIREQVHNVE